MMITADEMKKTMEEIYERLDKVSPVDFDCGNLCGEICCVYDKNQDATEELMLYLMPGEELMYEDSDYFELYTIGANASDYPDNWEDTLFIVKCTDPPRCDRKIRPIQCRTFPLIPHISSEDKFHLVFDESEYPYVCPLVDKKIKLNDDFVNETYSVWKMLLNNPVVYDLVKMDSRRRNEKKVEYEIVK
ncbi:MAG: hypothetical protein IJJ11_08300 [Methanosphaera sp.]|nr:hypothetical protein [Methanosphaera sp.]MBR3213062.1 hypothetical protein [Methanosphaera sp.]